MAEFIWDGHDDRFFVRPFAPICGVVRHGRRPDDVVLGNTDLDAMLERRPEQAMRWVGALRSALAVREM